MSKKAHLIIVYDHTEDGAREAADVMAYALGNEGHALYRYHHEDLSFEGYSVVFIGPPPAPMTLLWALKEANAVGVVAVHNPDIRPRGLMWFPGETLLEAAIKATGYRVPAA